MTARLPQIRTVGEKCADCGAALSAEPWAPGLGTSCLLQLGLTPDGDTNDVATGPSELPALGATIPSLEAGQVLGTRYRIRSLLGTGGMGEVYRAFDLKLRVDVALKSIRAALLDHEGAVTALRREVRAAREVVSPNICRVYDLVEFDGREFVSMEYVDGVTLADVLRDRSPLSLQEAREIASQFLAGLEAIHSAGLVHRDVKPENLMLTRAGRVVVMDFGIARAASPSRSETIAGTPAYMAPEQARGGVVEARADVYSAGIVLAEMVAPRGARDHHAREAIWRGVLRQPPDVGSTPWTAVLQRAVLPDPEPRYPSAAALARALEEVALRTSGEETHRPYPGLSAFSEGDADFFVGREFELEDMWKKLGRAHWLALIGPSGAGKTSFVRAGLVHTAPPGWRLVLATPRDRPFAALAQALAPEVAGDAAAVARLIDFEHPDAAVDVVGRWRRRHAQVLLVLDQFEELFTQSPPEVQQRFTELLARLALDADVHVLLSMRDDFFFHCHRFDSLAPLFSQVTAMGPPTGAALRRALVQPALKCGYRFEDESVIEEMLAQVTGERGALPLVAFAMARLWERRDRERGLLTRAAYDEIGGVGGALAQHAEATLDHIGQDRVAIVRELFRNLVTPQGTRLTLDRDELLSVFAEDTAPQPAGAGGSRRQETGEVLDALVAARLLTAYVLPSGDRESTGRPRVEIVHESLLTAWPRLVRWQTQDQDGAQLRDQLRQAARLWEARGKPEDLLWTGTSFREYALWRERYGGTLTSNEDTFARAMTARAKRRRLQRRAAVASLVTAALVVAIVMGVLWLQSDRARGQAIVAARRAEAQQLFALGQVELDRNPGAALAYAVASLERNDSPHVRRFVLRALWRGPAPFVVTEGVKAAGQPTLAFSRDNAWLAATNNLTGAVRLWKSDGSPGREIPGAPSPGNFAWVEFTGDGQSVVVTRADSVRIHSVATGEEVRRIEGSFRWGLVRGQSLITGSFAEPASDGRARRLFRVWPLPAGAPETTLGLWTVPPGAMGAFDADPLGQSMFGVHGDQLFETPLRQADQAAARLAMREPTSAFKVSSDGARIITWNAEGRGRVHARDTGVVVPGPRLDLPADRSLLVAETTRDGRWLAVASGTGSVQVSDLDGPVDADPFLVRTGDRALSVAIDASGSWMAVHGQQSLTLWPLRPQHPYVLRGDSAMRDVAIDPRGRWIAAGGQTQSSISIWPMQAGRGAARTLRALEVPILALAASPRGDLIAAATLAGVRLVPLDGRPPFRLPGFNSFLAALAFDRDGRRLAAGGGLGSALTAPGEAVVRVWNLDTGEVQVLDAGDGKAISSVAFAAGGRLLSAGMAGLRLWEPGAAAAISLLEGVSLATISRDDRYVLGIRGPMRPGGVIGTAIVYDLQERRSWDLAAHGSEVTAVAWHPSGTHVVTAGRDGVVRIGLATGEEPHLLFGHEAPIWAVSVEPQGKWIASTGDDGTIRLWPMPQGPPLHTLSHPALLKRLRSLSNYRLVEDSGSPGGYRLGFEPFTGWNRKPSRW